MIDAKLPIRKSFYSLLQGSLLDPNSNLVNVWGAVEAQSGDDPLYVLLENQNSFPLNNQAQFATHEDLQISIVARNPARVARSQVDYIASQILALVLPNPSKNGLPVQPGLQFLDMQLLGDTYQTFSLENGDAVTQRLMTFEMDCYQTN